MKISALFICVLLMATSCMPDIVVETLDVTWNDTTKSARSVISNRGSRSAGEFMVYFNVAENPPSSNHIPQVRHRLAGLARGASVELQADFIPLSHPDNNHLGNIYQITVVADAKNMVKESNETNNRKSFLLPVNEVNQSNLISSGNLVVANTQYIGQTFSVSRTSRLVGIEVAAVRCLATETNILTMEVGSGTTSFGTVDLSGLGLPGPGQCGVIPPPLSLTSNGSGLFDFTSWNRELVTGQTYYFKLRNASGSDFRIGISPDLYPDGNATVNDNPSSNKDLAFKIILAP